MSDNPNEGAIERASGLEAPSSESGMTIEDAVTTAYDDADRRQNGIPEGERETLAVT